MWMADSIRSLPGGGSQLRLFSLPVPATHDALAGPRRRRRRPRLRTARCSNRVPPAVGIAVLGDRGSTRMRGDSGGRFGAARWPHRRDRPLPWGGATGITPGSRAVCGDHLRPRDPRREPCGACAVAPARAGARQAVRATWAAVPGGLPVLQPPRVAARRVSVPRESIRTAGFSRDGRGRCSADHRIRWTHGHAEVEQPHAVRRLIGDHSPHAVA